ncbi:hypothetical protein VME_18270 [Vibrio harveyi 1DA3]|nr:hypothetical protein VME_18270 [Vibrio harveyi 1DA3]
MQTELMRVLTIYGLRHLDSTKIYESNPLETVIGIERSEGLAIHANVAQDLESLYKNDEFVFHLYDNYYLKMCDTFVTSRYELQVPFKVVRTDGESEYFSSDWDFRSDKLFFIGLKTKVRLANSSGLFKKTSQAETLVNFHVNRTLISYYEHSGELVRENVKLPLSNRQAFSGAYYDVWETLKELVKEHIYPHAKKEIEYIERKKV